MQQVMVDEGASKEPQEEKNCYSLEELHEVKLFLHSP
jgi:hypothetical protein